MMKNFQRTHMLNKIIIFGLNDLAELAWYYLTLNKLGDPYAVAFTANKEYITRNIFYITITIFIRYEWY